MDNVSFIIVNYNLAGEICECVNSIKEHIKSIGYEVIIVDNSSCESDKKTLADLADKHPDVKIFFLEENTGFGQACNYGAKKSQFDYLFFLNPDTAVPEDNFGLLIDVFANDEKVGVAGCNVGNKKYEDWSAGKLTNYGLELLNIVFVGNWLNAHQIYLSKKKNNNNKFEVGWVIGAALVIKKNLFLHLNGFDKRFFMFFEEVDLCRRVKEAGYKVVYVPKIKLYHHGSASAKKDYYFFTKTFYKSKVLYFNKHFSGVPKKVINAILYGQMFSQSILYLLLYFKNPFKSRGKLKAFKEMLFAYQELKKY